MSLPTFRPSRPPCRAAAGWLAAFVLVLPVAADAQGTIDRNAQAAYQREAASCRRAAREDQDRSTCMREAGAAREEARRGRLTDHQADYQRNATLRCDGLPEADRRDCLTRMQGSGTTTGSVKGGGVYRETVTRTPAEPMPPPKIIDTSPGQPLN